MSTTDISNNHICDIVKEIPFTWPKSLLMAYIHFISRGKMNFQKKLLGNLPFLRCDFGLPLYKYQNVCLSISNQNRSEEKRMQRSIYRVLERESLFSIAFMAQQHCLRKSFSSKKKWFLNTFEQKCIEVLLIHLLIDLFSNTKEFH